MKPKYVTSFMLYFTKNIVNMLHFLVKTGYPHAQLQRLPRAWWTKNGQQALPKSFSI